MWGAVFGDPISGGIAAVGLMLALGSMLDFCSLWKRHQRSKGG